MSKDRVLWMDVLRGLGILLVVVGHISKNATLVDWIYAFHMPLFFFSSGWLYRQRNIIHDIKRRAYNILIPYFSFALLIFVYWATFERHFRNPGIGILDSLWGIFIASYSTLAINVHLWFLPCFFLVCVIYNILIHSTAKVPTILLSLGLTIIAPLITMPEMPWCINRVPMYIGYFALGHLAAEYFRNIQKPIYNLAITYRVLISFVLWLLVWLLLPVYQTIPLIKPVLALLGIGGTIALSTVLSQSKLLQYIGKISLLILCIHGPIYRIIINILASVMNNTSDVVRTKTPITLLITVITCCICAIAYEIIKHIAPWMVGLPSKKRQQQASC